MLVQKKQESSGSESPGGQGLFCLKFVLIVVLIIYFYFTVCERNLPV